eukprot:ANDGO_06454.mRNA.1 Dol-P-Man:Man(7)GlcNAc(2)-PP-Dol alpha-1
MSGGSSVRKRVGNMSETLPSPRLNAGAYEKLYQDLLKNPSKLDEIVKSSMMIAAGSSSAAALGSPMQGVSWKKWLRLRILDIVMFFVVALYVCVGPYTKVEESFNVQAMHDMLFHGMDIAEYDHLQFPGVVPRTFIGALAVSLPVQLLVRTGLVSSKLAALYACRLVLGLYLVAAYSYFRASVRLHFGSVAATAFGVMSLCQFHIPFYMSRPLPNTFALCFALVAFGLWLRSKVYVAIAVLAFAAAVFRAELVIFAVPFILLELFVFKSVVLSKVFKAGLIASGIAVTASVLIDSYFWRRLLWPEFEVLFFNTVLNKSSDWGTASFDWYFSSALPRAMTGTYFIMTLGLLFNGRRGVRVFAPAFLFVFLYSFLPHKELRFIFYAIPLFTAVAAHGFSEVWTRSRHVLTHVSICFLILTAGATLGFAYVSALNYPGGHALVSLHRLENASPRKFVHMDTSATMTGVSRFLERADLGWRYSKNEKSGDFSRYSHLLHVDKDSAGFRQIFAQSGFDRLDATSLKVHLEDKTYAMRSVWAQEHQPVIFPDDAPRALLKWRINDVVDGSSKKKVLVVHICDPLPSPPDDNPVWDVRQNSFHVRYRTVSQTGIVQLRTWSLRLYSNVAFAHVSFSADETPACRQIGFEVPLKRSQSWPSLTMGGEDPAYVEHIDS